MNTITTEDRIAIAHKFVADLTDFSTEKGYCRYGMNVWNRGDKVRIYADKNGYAEIDNNGHCDTSSLARVCRRIAEEFVMLQEESAKATESAAEPTVEAVVEVSEDAGTTEESATVTEIAQNWLEANFDHHDGGWDDYMRDMQVFYEHNSDHLSDCFADTAYWAEGERFSQQDLEDEIVRIVRAYGE